MSFSVVVPNTIIWGTVLSISVEMMASGGAPLSVGEDKAAVGVAPTAPTETTPALSEGTADTMGK
jgi:hypothetical protein